VSVSSRAMVPATFGCGIRDPWPATRAWRRMRSYDQAARLPVWEGQAVGLAVASFVRTSTNGAWGS
jgi:hypothetical protein